jgi:acyl-coenzyme A synthetase/AMP-(fatty) acid ligase
MIPSPATVLTRLDPGRSGPVCVGEAGPVLMDEVLGRAAWVKARLSGGSRLVVLAARDRLSILVGILGTLAAGRDVILPPVEGRRPAAVGESLLLTDGEGDALGDEVHMGAEVLSAGGLFDGVDLCEGRIHFWTSGSTGDERSYPRTLGKLLAEAAFFTRHFEVTDEDLFLATVPGIHIYGLIYGILLPLWAGGAFWRETPFLPAQINALVRERPVTHLVSVPAHYKALASSLAGVGEETSLRMAFSSGGFLEEADSERFHAATGCSVHEIYGSTESGAVAERCRQGRDGEAFRFFSFLEGRAGGDGFLQVLSPVVAGSDGEEQDWFSCGDLVEIREGGCFKLLGRGDSIVKIGGRRFSLRRVEEVLLDVEAVKDCVVVARPSSSGRGNVLIAIVAGEGDASERAREALRAGLEPWQRPRRIVLIPSLPRTATGKLRRKELERLVADEAGARLGHPRCEADLA